MTISWVLHSQIDFICYQAPEEIRGLFATLSHMQKGKDKMRWNTDERIRMPLSQTSCGGSCGSLSGLFQLRNLNINPGWPIFLPSPVEFPLSKVLHVSKHSFTTEALFLFPLESASLCALAFNPLTCFHVHLLPGPLVRLSQVM